MFEKLKKFFKNLNCKSSCSNCIIEKTQNEITIDVNNDGIVDYRHIINKNIKKSTIL